LSKHGPWVQRGRCRLRWAWRMASRLADRLRRRMVSGNCGTLGTTGCPWVSPACAHGHLPSFPGAAEGASRLLAGAGACPDRQGPSPPLPLREPLEYPGATPMRGSRSQLAQRDVAPQQPVFQSFLSRDGDLPYSRNSLARPGGSSSGSDRALPSRGLSRVVCSQLRTCAATPRPLSVATSSSSASR
jgi:hypothetical protein